MPNTCENCTPRPSRDLHNVLGTSDKKELLKNIVLRMLKSCHDRRKRVIHKEDFTALFGFLQLSSLEWFCGIEQCHINVLISNLKSHQIVNRSKIVFLKKGQIVKSYGL